MGLRGESLSDDHFAAIARVNPRELPAAVLCGVWRSSLHPGELAMNLHRTYGIDGWTFAAHNNAVRSFDGVVDPKLYAVSMVLDDGPESLGQVRRIAPKHFLAVPKIDKVPENGMHPDHTRLPGHYPTL